MAQLIGASAAGPSSACRQEIIDLCRRISTLPPYEAVLAYRDVVRLEEPHIVAMIPDATARGKYSTYMKRFTQRPPGRYLTDHNNAQKLTPTLELVRSPDVASVLDAACGNGFEAVLFALQGKPVHANDISTARITVMQARAAFYRDLLGPALSLSVTCGDAIALADRLQRFDLIYVQEAISHIHPAESFLREVATRLLTPSGRLVICDSNGWNPVTRFRIGRQLWAERRTLRHYIVEMVEPETGRKYLMAEERLFSPPGIRRALRAAGLDLDRLIMSGFTLPQLVRSRRLATARTAEAVFSNVPLVRNLGGFYTAICRRRPA